MTACNDSQVTLGKKAVSAALAGTLAVGMVPGVALAATADEVEAGDGITAFTATEAQSFANSAVSEVQIGTATELGASQATPSGGVTLTKGTAAIVPVQLTSSITGATLDILDESGAPITDVTIKYTGKDASGKDFTAVTYDGTNLSALPTDPGTYTITITGANTWDGLTSTITYSIVGKSLNGTIIYDNDDADKDVDDTTFTYNGATQVPGFAIGGITLRQAEETVNSQKLPQQISVKYYQADKITPADGKDAANAPTNAGSYIAVVTGTADDVYENSEIQIPFTVDTLDLATADITAADVQQTNAAATNETTLTINGVAEDDTDAQWNAIADNFEVSYSANPVQLGSYDVTLTAKRTSTNVVNSRTVSYNLVASDDALFYYGDTALTANTAATAQECDLSLGQSFNLGALGVYNGTYDSAHKLTASQYAVTVTDLNTGKEVSASSLSTPGDYKVAIAVNSEAMKYQLGGKMNYYVKVINGTIKTSDIFVTYNDKTQASFTEVFNGSDFLKDLVVKVVVDGKTLVAGTDYQVTVKDNATNKPVTEIVNAGNYSVSVTSDTWKIEAGAADVCDFTVTPVPVNAATAAGQVTVDGKTGVAYTGNAITPQLQYGITDPKTNETTYYSLPASSYKVNAITCDGKKVTEVKKAGHYTLSISDADSDDNYAINAAGVTVTFDVIDAKRFADVPADAWYAEVVDQAAMAGYMSGYADTDLFGPNDKITRAQVACVLFNMSGGKVAGSDDNEFNENYGYTSFADVNPKAYYAQAVAWAKDAGVVNGFAGTDNFGPDQLVTREQFACMLWNYAKVNLSDTVKDVDVAAALASKPDGNKVSDWAKDGVAWAVQNKIMGNGGVIDPLTTVTRAETAAMVINYKPYVAVTSISVNPAKVSVAESATTKPVVTVTEIGGAATTWTASSSNTAVATVAADGTITGVKAGTATITYTPTANPKVTATCEVTVTA